MAYKFTTRLKQVAFEYLNAMKVNVTKSPLHQTLEEHPYYASLSYTFKHATNTDKRKKL
jgi:hypothetical protein